MRHGGVCSLLLAAVIYISRMQDAGSFPIAGGQNGHHVVHGECLPICAVKYELPLCTPCHSTKTLPYCTSAARLPTCNGKYCHNGDHRHHGSHHQQPESHGAHHGQPDECHEHLRHHGTNLGQHPHLGSGHGVSDHRGNQQGKPEHHGPHHQYTRNVVKKGDVDDPRNPKYVWSKEDTHGDHAMHHERGLHHNKGLHEGKSPFTELDERKRKEHEHKKNPQSSPNKHHNQVIGSHTAGKHTEQHGSRKHSEVENNPKYTIAKRKKRTIKGLELLPASVEALLSSSFEKF